MPRRCCTIEAVCQASRALCALLASPRGHQHRWRKGRAAPIAIYDRGATVNTEHLREFVVFAGHMNFTAAAKALNMSQPSLSRHVSELERRYGCDLVDRTGPVLRLTHCGRVLLAQAPELIAAEDALNAHMAEAAREPYGNLVVERYRKSPRIQSVISDALSALKSEHPGFSFTRRALKPGDSAAPAVLRGDLDVGIVACTTDRSPTCPVGPNQGFGIQELGGPHRERLFFVVSQASPLASRSSLRIADLDGYTFVYPYNPEFSRCLPDVTKLFEDRGLKLRSRPHELDEVEELGLMKIGPADVFIVVESAAASPGTFYLHNPDLVIIPCADDIWVTRYVIYRADDDNPVLTAFLEKLAETQP